MSSLWLAADYLLHCWWPLPCLAWLSTLCGSIHLLFPWWSSPHHPPPPPHQMWNKEQATSHHHTPPPPHQMWNKEQVMLISHHHSLSLYKIWSKDRTTPTSSLHTPPPHYQTSSKNLTSQPTQTTPPWPHCWLVSSSTTMVWLRAVTSLSCKTYLAGTAEMCFNLWRRYSVVLLSAWFCEPHSPTKWEKGSWEK